jgi:hypothetical protein
MGQQIINPIDKFEVVLSQYSKINPQTGQQVLTQKGMRLLERYRTGQKTSRALYHGIVMVANQGQYKFFSEGLPIAAASNPNNTLSNMTKNTLDSAQMLLITHILFSHAVIDSSTNAVTFQDSLENGGSAGLTPAFATANFTLEVNQSVVINPFPLRQSFPRWNPSAPSATAVIKQTSNAAAGTAITYGTQEKGSNWIELATPLLIDELLPFGVTLNMPKTYAIQTDDTVFCTLLGLGVVANAERI